jgi:hypothetical protein
MLQRLRERRRGLIVSAVISLGVAGIFGVLFALFGGFEVVGKSPPPSVLFRKALPMAVNATVVVFWILFLPQAVIELLKPPAP